MTKNKNMINDIIISINRSKCDDKSCRIHVQRVIRYDVVKDRINKINKLLNL